VPVRLAQAGRTLNFGLLAGEILGIDIEDARRVIEDVGMLPDSIAHVFLEDDLDLLLSVFKRVRGALAEAVAEDGRPVGDKGRQLAAHPLVEQPDEGRLSFRSQHVDLADLRFDLDRLCAFLDWAIQHGLLVQMVT
jgi:hypothetical protein